MTVATGFQARAVAEVLARRRVAAAVAARAAAVERVARREVAEAGRSRS